MDEVKEFHPLVEQWFLVNGYNFKHHVKLEDGIADYVAEKDGQLIVVECKVDKSATNGRFFAQILDYVRQIPSALPYVALPIHLITRKTRDICLYYGIEIIEINTIGTKPTSLNTLNNISALERMMSRRKRRDIPFLYNRHNMPGGGDNLLFAALNSIDMIGWDEAIVLQQIYNGNEGWKGTVEISGGYFSEYSYEKLHPDYSDEHIKKILDNLTKLRLIIQVEELFSVHYLNMEIMCRIWTKYNCPLSFDNTWEEHRLFHNDCDTYLVSPQLKMYWGINERNVEQAIRAITPYAYWIQEV